MDTMITGKGYTDRGGREYNEDAGFFSVAGDRGYALMADGLGGHGGGDRASRAVADTLKGCIQKWPAEQTLTREAVEEWISRANKTVIGMQTPACRMKTTLAFLCVDERAGSACLAHVGDSRIYYFKDGAYQFCTFDHSVSRMAVLAGEIGWEDIRFHADRNKLLRAIGKSEEVKAETKELPMEKNRNHCFLLCTDGFWEYVTEKEMEETLSVAESPEEWIEKMRVYLEGRAGEGNDNNSAIAVWVTDEKERRKEQTIK